jgi:hypothetical protein
MQVVASTSRVAFGKQCRAKVTNIALDHSAIALSERKPCLSLAAAVAPQQQCSSGNARDPTPRITHHDVPYTALQAVKSAPRISSSRRLSVAVRAGTEYDRDTGFVQEDNSGRSNIFPRKQQAYLKSSTSDAAASQGLGGFQGMCLCCVAAAGRQQGCWVVCLQCAGRRNVSF